MFWFYNGLVPELEALDKLDKDNQIVWQPTGNYIEVKRPISIEEALI